jgi:transcriptional regulator with XRE-family HTH domain
MHGEAFMIAEATTLVKIRLRDARASLGLTQKELARLARLHYNVISKCEHGGSIRILTAYAILEVLNGRRAQRNLPALELKDLTWKIEGEEDN